MRKLVFLFSILFSLTFQANASSTQSIIYSKNPIDSLLPKVFVLGNNEKAFEKITLEYETSLLAVCDYKTEPAFEAWLKTLIAIEDYSEKVKFDLKGVKMWIHVFWDKDGSIKYLGYSLKPNSRNVKEKDLTAFFNNFLPTFRLDLKSNKKYNHYGHAAFPLLAQSNSTK